MIGLVKFSNPFRIKGKCKTATVFRRRIGGHYEWSVSIAYEMEYPFKDAFFVEEFRRPDVGIDLGLRTLATLSDGVMIFLMALIFMMFRKVLSIVGKGIKL